MEHEAKLVCYAIAMVISLASFAQNKTTFTSINMAGIASGKSKSYGILQTINGIQNKGSFFGIGVGIDYYKYKTMPVFADVRTSVFEPNIFIYGDLGYDFPLHNKPGKEDYYYDNHQFFGGPYAEAGIGYRIRLLKNNFLLLTSGYGYKNLNNKTNYGASESPDDSYSTYEYGYSRILFKAGISF